MDTELSALIDEVVKEWDDVEAFAQVGGLLCDMVVNGAEMVVVCEAVQVNPYLDSVALIQKGGCEVLPRKSLTWLELDPARQGVTYSTEPLSATILSLPGGFHGMQLGTEEGLSNTDLKNENAS